MGWRGLGYVALVALADQEIRDPGVLEFPVVAAEIDWLGAFEKFGSLACPADVAGAAFQCRLNDARTPLFRAFYPFAFSEFPEGYFVCFSELRHTKIVVSSICRTYQRAVDNCLIVPSQCAGRFRRLINYTGYL